MSEPARKATMCQYMYATSFWTSQHTCATQVQMSSISNNAFHGHRTHNLIRKNRVEETSNTAATTVISSPLSLLLIASLICKGGDDALAEALADDALADVISKDADSCCGKLTKIPSTVQTIHQNSTHLLVFRPAPQENSSKRRYNSRVRSTN